MRIAYFSDNFYPEISGISDSIITTGTELASRGHEVCFISPYYPARDYKASRDKTRDALTIKRIPSIPLPNSPTGQSRIAIPIGESLGFLRRFKPDVLHTQSPYGTGLEALIAKKFLKVPLIGTNHTPLEEFIQYAPGGRLYKGPALKYETWYYNHCSFVTAPYQGLVDNMRTKGLTAPGRGVANPVPFPSSVKSDSQRTACKMAFDIPGHMVLVSGRLAPEKHVDVVLRAFKKVLQQVPDATLVITGNGSHEMLLKEEARRLGIEERVRFAGFVKPQQLDDFYCTADVYTIMSTAETQSLSLMQAFATGVPAVSVRSRGLVDYTPPDAGFLVDIGDEDALAARLSEILKDPELRERMGAAGAEFVKTLTPAKVADEWEKIYEDAISRAAARSSS